MQHPRLIHSNTNANLLAQHTAEKAHCLLIKHSDGWNNDRCEAWLQQSGHTCETHISQNSQRLPDVSQFTHIVVYGGIPCVKDAAHTEYLRHELTYLEQALSKDIPCLGICLSAQLIAHVLGAKVNPLPCNTIEFGFSLVSPTEAGKDFIQQPTNMLQWHCEGFDLPQDCTLLASGSVFPNQAFSYGKNTYGVQFHPEVTAEVLKHWHNRYLNCQDTQTDEFTKQKQCKEQLALFHRHATESGVWFEQFLESWTG